LDAAGHGPTNLVEKKKTQSIESVGVVKKKKKVKCRFSKTREIELKRIQLNKNKLYQKEPFPICYLRQPHVAKEAMAKRRGFSNPHKDLQGGKKR